MFTYLISPADNKTSLLLAFTIKEDTITGYVKAYAGYASGARGWLELYSNLFYNVLPRRNFKLFNYCIKEKFDDSKKVKFIRESDSTHAILHEDIMGEQEVEHIHLRFNEKITTDELKDFLNQLKTCEEVKQLSSKNTTEFFSHKVRQDIIKKYQQYEQDPSVYMFSNNPHYNNMQPNNMPTIFQHYECLYKHGLSGCEPNQINSEVKTASQEAYNFIPLVGGTFLLGAFGAAFFSKCWKQNKTQNSTQQLSLTQAESEHNKDNKMK